jgi:uncharacterized damage-inducible protein DinB
MASRKELRAKIAEARARAHRAIVESALDWNTPGAGGEGEESWSPRQSLEHAAGAELFFASLISVACGYPPIELKEQSFPTPADAAEQYALLTQKADSIIQYVSDEDLGKKVEKGRMQGMTVEALLELTANHSVEHAQQALAIAR